jgi:F0F1-type ATP synthase assembly protein I
MAEDPLSPRTPPKTLADRLSLTGSRIADLSKHAAMATKEAVVKMTETSKEAVSNAMEAKKERADGKLTKQIEETRAELKQNGPIETVPVMVTLPEFEQERMEVMAEEHAVLVDLVDHMHALSTRVDQLEHTYRALAIEEKAKLAEKKSKENGDDSRTGTSHGMTSALSLLGASLMWVVILTGLDRYVTSHGWMLFDSYPAEIPLWGLGAGSWVMFVLHQLGNAAPFLRVSRPMLVQTGLAVGITTMMALLLTDDTISTMSGVWTWGTAIAVAVLVSSSLVASAWKNTRNALRPNEEVEIID